MSTKAAKRLGWTLITVAVGAIVTGAGGVIWRAAVMSEQMSGLIKAVDGVGEKFDMATRVADNKMAAMRSRLAALEQRAARSEGDMSGVFRAIEELRDRLAAMEHGDLLGAREPVGGTGGGP